MCIGSRAWARVESRTLHVATWWLRDCLNGDMNMNLAFSAGAIDLKTAFDAVTEYWSPKVVAQVNDQYVKVAKVRGELVWHSHADEDELFYVVRGSLRIEY